MEINSLPNGGDTRPRLVGPDLLRILSMLMVTILHAMGKGGILHPEGLASLNYISCWYLDGLCEVATDCFFLLSGYFMVTTSLRPKRVFCLWGEVLFYSWGIYVVMHLLGWTGHPHSPMYGLILPVLTNNYWFIGQYLALCFLAPFINKTLCNLSKKDFLALLAVMVTLFSLIPTLLPMVEMFGGHGGTQLDWSLTLFLTGAYIRLHVKTPPKKWICLGLYLLCAVTAVTFRLILIGFASIISMLGRYGDALLMYNSPLVFMGAVCLFLLFIQVDVKEGALKSLVSKLTPTVLAVYLIQEQHELRDVLWTEFIPVAKFADSPFFIPGLIVLALSILFIAWGVDSLRNRLFLAMEGAIVRFRSGRGRGGER